MRIVRYLIHQRILQIRFCWKRYVLYLVSFYIGFLLPIFALAQYSHSKREKDYYFYQEMDKDVLASWMSSVYDIPANIFPGKFTVSAQTDVQMNEWKGKLVTVNGVDGKQKDFKEIPVTKGRTIHRSDEKKDNLVCILNQADAGTYGYGIGDMVLIKGNKFQVVGLVSDEHYKGTVYVPFSVLLTLVSLEGQQVQFSVKIRDSKAESIDWAAVIQNDIKVIDSNAELVYVEKGADRKRQVTQTLNRWKAQRLCIAIVSLAFFLLNELILLLGKLSNEKKSIAVRLSIGSTRFTELLISLIENIGMSIMAALLALGTVTPLGNMAGLKDMILVDWFTVCSSLIIAVIVCLALSAATAWKLSRMQIYAIIKSGDV